MPTAYYSRQYRSDRFNDRMANTDCLSENGTSHSMARKQFSGEGAVRSSTKNDYGRRTSHKIRETYFLDEEDGIQHLGVKDTNGFLDGFYSKARREHSNEGVVQTRPKKGYGSNYSISQSGKNSFADYGDDAFSRTQDTSPKSSASTSLTYHARPGRHEIKTKTDLGKLKDTSAFRPVNYGNVIHEPKRLAEFKWRELENASQEKERQFLLKYLKEGKFQDVPVNCTTTNIGDHLLYPGSFLGKSYEHHFVCVGVHSDGIEVIEYTSQYSSEAASSRSSSSSNPLAFAKIQKGYKTFQELKEKKTKKRLWPKELERFDDYEVVSRAENRIEKEKEGRWYNLFTNNCESFANWCKCGLNVSLQVKPQYKTSWEAVKLVKAVGSGAFQGVKAATEVAPNFLGEAVGLVLLVLDLPLVFH